MADGSRFGRIFIGLGLAAIALAGCSSTGVATRTVAQPEQVQPLPSSQVASTNLPAIGQSGAGPLPNGQLTTPPGPAGPVNPALTGQPVLGGSQPAMAGAGGQYPADTMRTASADGSFVTLDAVGSVPSAPGRDLSGGLTVEKLLGGWTIVSGPTQCRLNLTYTAKDGTSRYRASAPGCDLPGLSVTASWQLAGSQVQLFDEAGDMIAALILSGNRFIGTLAGGQGISMVS